MRMNERTRIFKKVVLLLIATVTSVALYSLSLIDSLDE